MLTLPAMEPRSMSNTTVTQKYTHRSIQTPSEFKPVISSPHIRVFENGSLAIHNAQKSDAAFYLCQASNGIGPGLSKVLNLTVHGKQINFGSSLIQL